MKLPSVSIYIEWPFAPPNSSGICAFAAIWIPNMERGESKRWWEGGEGGWDGMRYLAASCQFQAHHRTLSIGLKKHEPKYLVFVSHSKETKRRGKTNVDTYLYTAT